MFKELKGSYLLACSGGPDSMALFDMLIKNNIKFEVAHINYHHRDTAERDQLIVYEFCLRNNIRFNLKDFEEGKGNFQDQARVFRYNFFRELTNKHQLDGVIVAHHLDDLLETYFLQTSRGSIPSVYGLSETAELNGLKVYRPLLSLTKKELVEYCDKNLIPYGIDESNLTDIYKRNEIRHSLIDSMTKDQKLNVLNDINKLNDNLKRRKESVKDYLDKEYLTVAEYEDIEDKDMFLRLKIDMSLSRNYIEDINRQLLSSNKVKIEINDHIISKEYEKIYIFTNNSDYKYILYKGEIIDTVYFSLRNEGTNFEAVNLSDDDYPIVIRRAKEGDEIAMRYGTKKVNRFFIDKKIPLKDRLKWPVIENSKGKVIHVSGIGSDIDHYASEPTFFMIKL